MENKLRKLFDYQRFAQNKRLAKLIAEAECLQADALSDEDLEFVCAAGEIDAACVGREDKDRNGNE